MSAAGLLAGQTSLITTQPRVRESAQTLLDLLHIAESLIGIPTL